MPDPLHPEDGPKHVSCQAAVPTPLGRLSGSAFSLSSPVYPSLESDEDSPVFKSRSKKRKASDDAPYSPTGSTGAGGSSHTWQDKHGTVALCRAHWGVTCLPPSWGLGPRCSCGWVAMVFPQWASPFPGFSSVSSLGGPPLHPAAAMAGSGPCPLST